MTLETFLLLIRHAMTAVGVYVTAATPITSSEWDQFAGAGLTMIGLVWSFIRKWKRANA